MQPATNRETAASAAGDGHHRALPRQHTGVSASAVLEDRRPAEQSGAAVAASRRYVCCAAPAHPMQGYANLLYPRRHSLPALAVPECGGRMLADGIHSLRMIHHRGVFIRFECRSSRATGSHPATPARHLARIVAEDPRRCADAPSSLPKHARAQHILSRSAFVSQRRSVRTMRRAPFAQDGQG